MNEVAINRRTYQVPSNYNELTAQQLRKIVQVMLSKLNPVRSKVLLMKILVWKNNWWFRRLPDHAIADMLLLTDWLIEKDEKERFRKPNLIKQLFPQIKIGFKKYAGPADALSNITLNEWARTEQYFVKYRETLDMKYLDLLIAVMYRPIDKAKKPADTNYDGDQREAFNDFNYQLRAKKCAKIKLFTKLSILYFYEGSRDFIFNHPDFAEIFKHKESSSKGRKNSWIDFTVNLAGRQWGDEAVKNIGNSKLYTIFFQLNLALANEPKK